MGMRTRRGNKKRARTVEEDTDVERLGSLGLMEAKSRGRACRSCRSLVLFCFFLSCSSIFIFQTHSAAPQLSTAVLGHLIHALIPVAEMPTAEPRSVTGVSSGLRCLGECLYMSYRSRYTGSTCLYASIRA